MKGESAKLLGFIAAIAALGLIVAVFGGRVLGVAAGPENEIITFLKKQEKMGQAFDASQSLLGKRVSYQRISVSLEPGGTRALVSCTLDFTGSLKDTNVSSLGFEKIPFVLENGSWRPARGPAPRLAAIVRALERRARALEAGSIPDVEGLDRAEADRYRSLTRRHFTPLSWFIRSEREAIEVSEDYWLEGQAPDRPVDERGTRKLSLSEDALGEFLFPHGLL